MAKEAIKELKIGGYPPEYDPVKHGPYDPARYYGKGKLVLALLTYIRLLSFSLVIAQSSSLII